jgi:muramoyltetrapeptide carboxypeptidase
MPLIKPPRLRQGDLVGLIAPSGHASDAQIERCVATIEKQGFKVKLGTHLREVWGNYGGAVEHRRADLHAMFADRDVKAVWPVKGGSGAISVIGSLDYKLIRANPKIFIGYSDTTAYHLAMLRHAGLVTFHGPGAVHGPSEYAMGHLMALLTDPQASYTIPMALENSRRALEEPHYAIRTVHGGQATGPLIGGNLSMVAALAGTPYAADFRKAILFLEDVNEQPYRIDRWLSQLDLSVGLKAAAALLVGICDNCGPEKGESSLTLDETLDVHLKPLTVPAVSGYSFGHIRHQFTLPMGIRARLDAERQTLTLLEPAVS